MENFDIEKYEMMKPHERSLLDLVESISGRCSKSIVTVDKTCTIRLNYDVYPQVRAMVELSGNSLNTVVNELLTVSLAAVTSNLDDERLQALEKIAEPIRKQMLGVK